MQYIKIIILFSVLLYARPCRAQLPAGKASQEAVDDEKLNNYFKEHHIRAQKAGGIYYTISTPGSGPKIRPGQTVTIDYTGHLLDGALFDSNTDPRFQHMDPLVFQVGAGRVIKGWEVGLQLLSNGSAATLYIPSGMAYGARGRGKIPPNSILVFDISVTDVSQ